MRLTARRDTVKRDDPLAFVNAFMSERVDFLTELLAEGNARLTARPCFDNGSRAEASRVLAGAFAGYRLTIPGPLLDLDKDSALAAAELVWLASWYLLVRDAPPAEVEYTLRTACSFPSPKTGAGKASQHLSVDLTLRYLPQLLQRARTVAPDDVLTTTLIEILRQWPLSGVLADLHEPPLRAIEELEHPGLFLLYAERFAEQPRPEWLPREGPARQWVERILEERKETAGAARNSCPAAS